ncbi:serine/threonine-protein kinase [Frankia sp. Cppng1_Ct_nod]|uniref:serine/threonine-protein kinase n=1 Tax=Frankia sp. Cppng1_Ct_nod TaxID=2897162 RepID=UPI0010414FBD|nr:serine/threonine-protein kinase [Frankia sp. Cppng1_Ct_nod]
MNGRGEELDASGPYGGEVPQLPAGVRPMPGDPHRIGPYRVFGRLGEGGMGVVYFGQAPDGRFVAVKVVASRHARDEDFLLRFRHEGDHARRVPRFCTAEVLDVDVTAQPPYLVTEYIDGPTLQEAVRSGGPLRKAELDQLAVAMVTALSAIHGAGLVHRDLKPGNVLLSRMGPRVIDFGIARTMEASAGLTATGVVVGTGSYMAPEQHMGDGATPASDVFAWGGVMAYAASGHAPFGNGPPHMIAYRVVHGEPDMVALDPPLREAVTAALRKNPAHRPSVGQLLHMLGVPGGAGPGHYQPPVGQFPVGQFPVVRSAPDRNGRRWWLPASVALAAVVLVAAVGVVLSSSGSDHSDSRSGVLVAGAASSVPARVTSTTGSPTTGSPVPAVGSLGGHWTGTWGSGDHEHFVAVDGANFRMIYDYENGRVSGTLRGDTIRARWAEGPISLPPVRTGWVEFRVVRSGAGVRLDGQWGDDTGGGVGTWQIWRVDGVVTPDAAARLSDRTIFPAPPS